ncbi:MAG: thioesterase [Deltaproteobacteria bacterium]|nr:MAG: thioesterase [Deltaproteobacteria bacterium]TNF25171.1 MAG: thioesterase [Deltaproteobacteria bacterium]
MERLKLKLPEKKLFETQHTLRIDDMNYGGHLSNDKVLAIFHDMRVQWLKEYGFSELKAFGSSLIMTDSQVQYRAEGFQGDQLDSTLLLGEIGNTGFELYYLLVRKSDQKEIARGKTGMAFFDYDARKVARIPDEFTKYIEGISYGTD